MELHPAMLLPIQHALQGHPESGKLWAEMINPILVNLGFVNSKVAPCFYCDTFEGKLVMICRQVDNFKTAAAEKLTINAFFDAIGTKVRFVGNDELFPRFNGVDSYQ